MSETELKLQVALENMPRAPRVLAGNERDQSSETLVSTYYDTPDYTLKQHGLTLRVRRKGDRFVQTVKRDALNGQDLLTRGEWEDEVPGDRPEPSAPNSGSVLPSDATPDSLRPMFVTSVRRSVLTLEPRPGTRIEVAFDEGEIRALGAGSTKPISEIEIELKSGELAALYDVAFMLLDAVPVRVEAFSKAARGYRLVQGPEAKPAAQHCQPIDLKATLSVEEALQQIGRICLRTLLQNEPAALADLPEGVHQMRVASRRLRSFLSAMKRMLPAQQYGAVNDELKWLANALGSARDWDVVTTNLIEPVSTAAASDLDFSPLNEVAHRERQAAYERARSAIQSQRYTRVVLLLMRWIECREWREQPIAELPAQLVAHIGKVAPDLIDRQYRKARKRSKRFRQAGVMQRHRLRIALKELRYTADFLKSLFDPAEIESFNGRLKHLQGDLGDANDLRVANELFSKLDHGGNQPDEVARAAGFVSGWHKMRLTNHETVIHKHVRRFRRAAPFW